MKLDRYILPTLLVIAIGLVIFMYMPLLDAIAYGVLFAYLSRPIVKKIEPALGDIAAPILTLLIIVSAILLILLYSGVQIFLELNKISVDTWVNGAVTAGGHISKFISEHPEASPLVNSLSSQLNVYINMLTTRIFDLVFQLVNLIVTIVMALVIAFFLLKDGSHFAEFLERALPRRISKYISYMDDNMEGIFVGSVFSSLTVGVITVITFLLFSIPYAFISGFIAALLQFIPMVGPQLFMIPATIYYLLVGDFYHAIVMFALAVFLFFVPDNVIKPMILRKTTTIHPLLVLLAFIGGVIIMGPKGFVIGPIILAGLDGLIRAWLG